MYFRLAAGSVVTAGWLKILVKKIHGNIAASWKERNVLFIESDPSVESWSLAIKMSFACWAHITMGKEGELGHWGLGGMPSRGKLDEAVGNYHAQHAETLLGVMATEPKEPVKVCSVLFFTRCDSLNHNETTVAQQ